MSAETSGADEVSNFYKHIEDFAKEFVENVAYREEPPKESKIIHDPLWGTIKLHPWEVALLNLPLFQRLRQIHQTSLVSYVFPGCSHTRFEHTLGVIQQTQKLIDAVNGNNRSLNDDAPYGPALIRNLRLAALFHDCGHSCFSHISEELYSSCSDIKALFETKDFPKCHPHEAISASILRSNPVREYIQYLSHHYDRSFDIDHAANYIMGIPAMSTAPNRYYDTQIISGPFDADKIDYLFRDAHYSGIPVGLDLDRLWASCSIVRLEKSEEVLTLHQASVAPLEQILFSKANLFSIVYQHPKVRAAEKMFHGVIESVQSNNDQHFQIGERKIKFNLATDFLWVTDEGFFSEALRRQPGDPLHKKIHNIRYRRLLVRALTISHDTISPKCAGEYLQLRKLNQNSDGTYEAKRKIALLIIEASGLKDKMDPWDVWVDIPKDPKFGEADRTIVRTPANKTRKVSDFFPIHYWSELYQKYKWRGHVFCPAQYKQEIHDAAIEVFRENYGLRFQKSAGEASHVPYPKDSCD
jgi:HD superfamily phosphohydrolase